VKNNKKCPKCGFDKIKEIDSPEYFLLWKPEGKIAKKAKSKIKQKYYCHNCYYGWEEDIKYE
jgi:hypothetical protein